MNATEQVAEWIKHYDISFRKMNALSACLENDGEKMLQQVLKKLGLASAVDVVKACKDDTKRATRP